VLSQKVPEGAKHWNPLGPKQKSALELYDDLREKAGFDAWDVLYHSKSNGASELSGCRARLMRGLHSQDQLAGTANQSSLVQVQSRKSTHANVRIPHVDLSPPPSTDNEEREDWKTSLDEFQEWLGLACMGSQR
jgi:hypothetical protein